MKYFFILGSNPTLSVAEISVVFKLNKAAKETKFSIGNLVSENVFILEIDNIEADKIIKKIGGTIKIGRIENESKNQKEEIVKKAGALISPKIGKLKFGISYYGKGELNIRPIGMEIKKYLKEKGVSCRWVTSREPVLSSVVVEQNKLIESGAEIVLIKQNEKILIGKTLAVQPFKELSFRDYGRPARDDFSGMLPPKLAQIMINLALAPLIKGDGGIILDPFCGSGTILTEAILMGYKNIIGSDISAKAIEDTEKNINWTKINYQLSIINYQLFNKNVLELSKFIKSNSIDAIVTEPYLGPQRGRVDIIKIKKELENLYSKCLIEFRKVLKDNGRIVMVWPVFHVSHNTYHVSPNLNGLKIINSIPENLRDNKIIQLTNRNTIIYGRPGQKVWREIVILEK